MSYSFEIMLNDRHLCHVMCDTDQELLEFIKAFRNENPERGDLSLVIRAAVPFVAYMRQFGESDNASPEPK